uniref:U2A'/phosphoprotein 32 family A C-terminal domain-containing protein n=1 Tax=Parascaris univalens TaxID=6257 RepID=A0A915BFH6_PARUN
MVRLSESIVYSRTKAAVDVVKKLNLWGCDIDNIELCARMTNLQVLSLSMNRVSCLEPLKHCTRLEELYLRRNAITSLNELEHLKSLKYLRTLWIDENPCTADNAHRSKVLMILPNLTKLDDKPVTVDDLLEVQGNQVEYLRANQQESRHNSGNFEVIVADERRIVDTVMPSNAHVLNLVSSNSMNVLDDDSPCRAMQTSIYGSIIEDEKIDDEDNWHDFTLDERHSPPAEMSMSMSMNPQMFQSLYEGSQSSRQSRGYRMPLSLQQRSISVPRRRYPSVSMSPVRRQRLEKIMSAVNVLLDELDGDGLRRVIDEAQRRIKKQR